MFNKNKKLGMASVMCMLACINTTEAVVTLTFEQVGDNVTATWSGSYDLPIPNTSAEATSNTSRLSSTSAYGYEEVGIDQPGLRPVRSWNSGVATGSSLATIGGTYSGEPFGYVSHGLIFLEGKSGTYSPSGTMTFANTTLSAIGAASFANTLAFTGNNNASGSQEIRFNTLGAVPEPASALLGGVAILALAVRRRRTS